MAQYAAQLVQADKISPHYQSLARDAILLNSYLRSSAKGVFLQCRFEGGKELFGIVPMKQEGDVLGYDYPSSVVAGLFFLHDDNEFSRQQIEFVRPLGGAGVAPGCDFDEDSAFGGTADIGLDSAGTWNLLDGSTQGIQCGAGFGGFRDPRETVESGDLAFEIFDRGLQVCAGLIVALGARFAQPLHGLNVLAFGEKDPRLGSIEERDDGIIGRENPKGLVHGPMGFREFAHPAVAVRDVVQDSSDTRSRRTRRLLPDAQGSLIEVEGFLVSFLLRAQNAEVHPCRGRRLILETRCTQFRCLVEQPLRLGRAALAQGVTQGKQGTQ